MMLRTIACLAALSAFVLGLPSAASSASLGAVGNKVEMYGENDQNNCNTACFVVFPLNNTGKVIKIENVTCEVSIVNSLQLISAWVGPSTMPSGTFIKKSWFPERAVSGNASPYQFTIASHPGMLLGASRYLQVRVSAGGTVNMRCSASGIFAL